MKKNKKFILWLKDIRAKDVSFVGGKNASLGEMYAKLVPLGIKIPNGFAVTAYAYQYFLKKNKLDHKIRTIIKDLNRSDVRDLARRGGEIRRLILEANMPGRSG